MNLIETVALTLFGEWVTKRRERYIGVQTRLRKASITKPIGAYISLAYLTSLVFSIFSGFIAFLITCIIFPQKAIVALMAIVITSAAFGFLVYYLFLQYPLFRSKVKKTAIDITLPYAVAYMHAMSKGGMNIIEIFKSLSEHTHLFMEAAEEVSLMVRDMTFFGMDVMTALHKARERTPSKKFKDFIENLTSVLDSGGDITAFFKSKSEQYQSEALEEQKSYLDTLGMVAESYVTAFVAGPLFLITILIVMGIAGSGSLLMVELVIYLIVPVGSVAFILLLNAISVPKLVASDVYEKIKELKEYDDIRLIEKSYEEEDSLFKEFEKAEKRLKIIKMIKDPFKFFYERPSRVMYVSIPTSLLYFIYKAHSEITFLSGTVSTTIDLSNIDATVGLLDEYIIIMILLLLGPFAFFYELRKTRIKRIEKAIPNFLQRLASINEAGISLTQAIGIIVNSNLGILTSEIKKIWKDISWGRGTTESLIKFENRIKTTAISRTITLITKASEATGNIKGVLSIAASDSEIDERLKKERSMEMSTYLILIYISFCVFLVIIYILSTSFLSILPENSVEIQTMPGVPTQSFEVEKYNRIFFHAAVVQGFFSGIIAGVMGEGSAYAGIKHSVIMVMIAYITFIYVVGVA